MLVWILFWFNCYSPSPHNCMGNATDIGNHLDQHWTATIHLGQQASNSTNTSISCFKQQILTMQCNGWRLLKRNRYLCGLDLLVLLWAVTLLSLPPYLQYCQDNCQVHNTTLIVTAFENMYFANFFLVHIFDNMFLIKSRTLKSF